MSNHTGISMCGSIINAKRPGLIPCDCMKCSQRRKYKSSNGYYLCIFLCETLRCKHK